MANCNNARRHRAERILTIDPRIRRLCVAYFEGAVLGDWDIRNVRQDPPDLRVRKRLIPALIRMLDRYEPVALITPDIGPTGVRRSANVREVIQAVTREALERGIEVVAVSERQVRETFERARPGAGRNKVARDDLILEWFPTLSPQRPKARRDWEGERHATPLFDAIARWCAWKGLPAMPSVA